MSTCWRWLRRAATSSTATESSPASTRVRGSPLTIVFESARSFSLNVSSAASTTARKRTNPASTGLTSSNVIRLRPAISSTGFVWTSVPLANSRTVAVWATVERISTTTGTVSPRRAVEGVVSRSMRTSSTSPRPIRRVSMRTPREAARAASDWPSPVVSLPSDSRTIRFCASSGKSAAARRRAAPMSVAERTGAEASRSISVNSPGSRSTSASLPNATIPATSPSGRSVSVSRRKARASSRPALPTESERSTTKTVASRSTGRTSWKPARAKTSAASRSDRTTRAARRRPEPIRRRAPRWSPIVSSRAGISRSSASGASNEMPIRRVPSGAFRPNRAPRPRRSRISASRW